MQGIKLTEPSNHTKIGTVLQPDPYSDLFDRVITCFRIYSGTGTVHISANSSQPSMEGSEPETTTIPTKSESTTGVNPTAK